MTQTETNNLVNQFNTELTKMLKAIEDCARKQFNYTVATNIPAGIIKPSEAVQRSIDSGLVHAHAQIHKWDGDIAFELAGHVLEECNLHAEAAAMRAVA